MGKSISSLLNEVKIATQEYVTAKVLAGQLTEAELGIDMLKALESPLSIADKLSAKAPEYEKGRLELSCAGVDANPVDNTVPNSPYKKYRIRGKNNSFCEEPPFYFIHNEKLYKVGKLNGDNKKPFYKKMVPAEELPYLLETLMMLLDENGKVAVKDYLQKIKLEAPNSYGRKISEYRCYVVVGALEKAGILEQKERGKYCYAGKRTPSTMQIMDALHALEKREALLSQAE